MNFRKYKYTNRRRRGWLVYAVVAVILVYSAQSYSMDLSNARFDARMDDLISLVLYFTYFVAWALGFHKAGQR